jgi:Skp family chaperone for outer membrane proteins
MLKTWLVAVPSAVVGSVLSLTLVGQAQAPKPPSPVAYVNANRVLNESTHGRAEFARLQALQQQKNGELRTKQQALEATRQELAKNPDPAKRTELLLQEQQQRTDFERSSQQAQTEMQTLQREVNTDMQQRVKAALDEIMKTQSYDMVLNGDTSVMWASPQTDLTAAVVGRLNGR